MSQSSPREYVEERFGAEVPGKLVDRGDIWLCTENGDYETTGIRALRRNKFGYKPTTYFLQLLDQRIEKNRAELSREEFKALLNGEMVEREGEDGYVALFFDGRCFGCGLQKYGKVSSRIPKGRAEELLKAFQR